MARLPCPHCNRKVKVPQYVVYAVICCPHCAQTYHVRGDPRSAPLAPPPPREQPGDPPTPLLAPPHSCQHCGESLPDPVGREAATVECPSCGNKTSVYAIQHRCPRCGRLLESPARSAGQEVDCPACTRPLRVPADLLREAPPDGADEFWFGFYCLACSEEVAAREKDAGAYAVCPHCRVPCVVPHSGHYLKGTAPAAEVRDPMDSLHPRKEVVCPACHDRFPAAAPACPACGARPPSPSGW